MSKNTRKVILRPLNTVGDILFSGNYYDNSRGEHVNLLMKPTHGVLIDGKVELPMLALMFDFNQENREMEFELDKDNKRDQEFYERLCFHNNVRPSHVHNPNLINPLFELIDEGERHSSEATLVKQKISVGNIVTNISTEKQVDICFAFGGYPVGMTEDELILDLLHPQTGRLLVGSHTVAGKPMDKAAYFLLMWEKQEQGESDEMMLAILIKKALGLPEDIRPITHAEGEDVYKVVGKLAGRTEEAVMAYLKENKQAASYVKSIVDENQHLFVISGEEVKQNKKPLGNTESEKKKETINILSNKGGSGPAKKANIAKTNAAIDDFNAKASAPPIVPTIPVPAG